MVSTKTRINASVSATLGLVLLAVAATTTAGENNTAHIDTCKSEVRDQYSTESIMIVSERRIPSGTQVRLAAHIDQDTTRILNCWVPSNTNDDGSYSQGVDTLAARLVPVSTIASQ